MKFSRKILETFIDLPADWQDLMEDVGLEIKSLDGDIMNLELLANRGDHYCYEGLACEIHGRTGTKMKFPETLSLFEKEPEWESIEKPKTLSKYKNIDYKFEVETEKCLAFSLMPYKKTSKKSSLADYGYMLEAAGVNSILPAIDITNVVMLEAGQPAHIYDADKVKGKIRIRESRPGEKAALLFHEGETTLPAGTVVIADEEKILCIGGVIGCRAAEVDENTKNILLETALFDPVSVRKTARALGVSSIASQIFERGGDAGAVQHGAMRAKKLYTDAGWEQSGDFQQIQRWSEMRIITLPGDYVRAQLGVEISDAEIEERLGHYGFIKNSRCNPDLCKSPDEYTIPTWRMFNIKGEPAELIEVLAISLGYNNLPSKLPMVEIGAAPTEAEVRKAEINSYLIHNGFFEVFTDSMYSPKHAAIFGGAEKHIALENSIEGNYAFMKNNAIVQAVELVEKNLRVKNREIRAFEWGKVFQGDREIEVLWGIMNGANASALGMKGLIKNLLDGLGIDFKIEPSDLSQLKMHPKRSAKILIAGAPEEDYGVLGEIHPKLLAEFDIKNDSPVFFKLFVSDLLNAPKKPVKYESPSAIIPSSRDISIAVPYGKYVGDVAEFIKKTYPQIARAEIADVYDKPKESLRNVTFTLTFTGEHSTESLNALILEIMDKATKFVS